MQRTECFASWRPTRASTRSGTNTWVVGAGPSIVIDPGPDDATHLREDRERRAASGRSCSRSAHPDHAPGAEPLAASTGRRSTPFDRRRGACGFETAIRFGWGTSP